MNSNMNIMLLISLFFATVMGLPHVGMLDTPDVRDVGLIFDDLNYTGNSTFIIEVKNNPTCLPINVDANSHAQGLRIKSIQICKPTTCAFFTGEKCTSASTGVFSVACTGPGDVPNHNLDMLFKSYICGQNISRRVALERVATLETVPHDPNAGMV
ncbi:uncharacterized protein N0V89_009201 [Didymosphaeria variabile]|uniref:Uncharacterized protein n=1 Tax=Didymosphaeria variabile TaxID=1932322 RepID=A0A9W9C722_9PLEO|nr:uncharacterized protein N0V89_009201 [Didymosphaeria variabile]KAJ4347831.1 hypothetical protein N0V89_009201 [Didymosphaeria variabile]